MERLSYVGLRGRGVLGRAVVSEIVMQQKVIRSSSLAQRSR